VLLAVVLGWGRARITNLHVLRGYCLVIVAGIAANAIICGVISGPNGRYQMRVVWILPVVAASVVASRVPVGRHPLGASGSVRQKRAEGEKGGASVGAIT